MSKPASGYTTLFSVFITGIISYILTSIYFHNTALVYAQDAEEILAPMFFDISRAIHRYGLWAGMYDPGQVAGLSLWDTPYFHPLYPFYFNWVGSDTNIFDTMARLRLINLLHLSIYGSGSYFLCRAIKVKQWLALAVGLSAPWFPALHSMLNWPQILASFAWIPWIMACQVLLYGKLVPITRAFATIGLAAAFSLLVYAQPAQNMVLAITGSAAMWLYMALSSLRSSTRETKQNFIQSTYSLALAGFIALLLCGKYLYSVVIYMSGAIRWVGSHGIVIGHQRMPLSAFREHALHWTDIVALFSYRPEHTVIIGNLYVGAPLLLCAVFLCRREASNRALLCSALFTTLLCFGIFAPIVQWLPVVNKVRELNWWSCYTVAIMLPLSARGLQVLFDSAQLAKPGTSSENRSGVLMALFASLGITVTLLILDKAPTFELAVTCMSFIIAIWYYARRPSAKWISQFASGGLVVLSACAPAFAYPRYPIDVALLKRPDHLLTFQEAREISTHVTDRENFRFAVSTDLPNYKQFTVTLANLDLRGLRGNVSPQEYDKFRLLFFPNPAVADLYGVKYEVIPNNRRQPSDPSIDQQISLHVNARALPRVFFVQGGVKVVQSPIDSLLNASSTTLHFFVAPRDLPNGLNFSPYAAGGPTIILPDMNKNTPVDIRGTLRAEGPGLLVLNEDPAARWQATLDGKPVDTMRINGFQTAFPVSTAGQHQLEIKRPGHLFE